MYQPEHGAASHDGARVLASFKRGVIELLDLWKLEI